MTATASPPASTVAPPPLWPKPIPVLGVTGPYAAGKTVLLLSIAPGPQTRIYDTEKSSESYTELGFDRVDVPAEMLKQKPTGYRPLDTFEWWAKDIRAIQPGRFRVIAIDVAEEIEAGLAAWVWENPILFGKTRAQYVKMEGLYWGDVKAFWKQILATLASKCETFAFSTHMGKVWSNNAPTNRDKPKGKSTLMELASLYLQMQRDKDASGNLPPHPSAIVLKSRLMFPTVIDGEVKVVQALPPRLPIATPGAIREYLRNKPRDPRAYTAEERAPEPIRTDDERADMRLETARAEADAERLRLERLHEEQKVRGASGPVAVADAGETASDGANDHEAEPAAAVSPIAFPVPEAFPGITAVEPPVSPPAAATAPTADAPPPPAKASSLPADDRTAVRQLFEEFCHLKELTRDAMDMTWKAVHKKYDVKDDRSLTKAHWAELRTLMMGKVKEAYTAKGIPDACPF